MYFPGCWLIKSEPKYVLIFPKSLCLEQFIQIYLNVKYMKSLIFEQSECSKDKTLGVAQLVECYPIACSIPRLQSTCPECELNHQRGMQEAAN